MKKISMYLMMFALSAMVMVSCGESSDKEGKDKEGDKKETAEELVKKANEQVDALLEKIGAAEGAEQEALMEELKTLGKEYKDKISEEEHNKIGKKVNKFMQELAEKQMPEEEGEEGETEEVETEEVETEETPQ